MGRRGKIKEGDLRKDYQKADPVWVTYKSTEDNSDIDYIEEQCGKKFSEEIKQRIKNEINEYLNLKEMNI